MSDENKLPSPEELQEFITTAVDAASEALQNGNHDAAARLFNEILSIVPNNPIAHNGIGLIAVTSNQANIAEHHFRKAVEHAPDWAEPHVNLGLVFLHGGRARRAVKMFTKALEIKPDETNVRYFLAEALQKQGKKEAYEEALRHITNDDPHHAPACNDLGVIEAQRGNYDIAIELFSKAADAPEPTTGARTNMGNMQLLTDDNLGADKTFDLVLKETPNSIEALIGQAIAKRRIGDLDAALLAAERAASLAPDNSAAKNTAGTIYRELGILDAAESQFTEALELAPKDPSPRSNLALIRLLHGEWKKAWPDYEARAHVPGFKLSWGMPNLPLWDGSDLNGQSILVLSEQGLGDSIQFARFLPMLAKSAKNTHFAVQPELVPLMRSLDGDISLLEPETSLPEIDVQSLLLSLPGRLDIDSPDSISGAPYLKAPALPDNLGDAISKMDGFKVGLNWQGAAKHSEDSKRSISIEALSSILGVDGVSFVSLNFSESDKTLPANMTDVSELVSDFGDSAALINELDLVISVDTATVHLAGSLGKDCWAMIPFVPDWRWLLDADTTPWYDSVKLYRQPKLGDWESVIERVKTDLISASAS